MTFMNQAVQMGSGGMMYVPSFAKLVLGGGWYTDTQAGGRIGIV
jgi:hypothetical protein